MPYYSVSCLIQTVIFIFQIGKSKVFLRAGQMAELDARRIEVLANAARLIQRQIRTYLTRKEFIVLRKATIHMQKLWRGYFTLTSMFFNLDVVNAVHKHVIFAFKRPPCP